MGKVDELRREVRERGLRATPSRVAVLELLRATETMMSHGDVADRLSSQDWDRATIYRNLIDLSEAGLARRSDVGDHVWRFEAVTDDNDAAHPHFVCTECGAVECLPEIELSVKRAKAPRAVRTKQVEVHVRGICDSCA